MMRWRCRPKSVRATPWRVRRHFILFVLCVAGSRHISSCRFVGRYCLRDDPCAMTDYKHTHTHTRARARAHTHTHTRPFRVLQTGTRCDRHRKPRPTSSTHVKRSTPTGSMSTTKQQPHKRPHLRAKQQRRPAGKIACWLRRILWRRRPTQRRQRWGQRPTAALRLRIRVWGVSLCLTRPQLRDMVQKDCNGAGGTASPPAVRIWSETYRCSDMPSRPREANPF